LRNICQSPNSLVANLIIIYYKFKKIKIMANKGLFFSLIIVFFLSACGDEGIGKKKSEPLQYNILLITADDLDKFSLGCYGSQVEDISPNIDKFASEGIRFENGFINHAICMPSRAIIGTGRYGHNSGAMGFMHIDHAGAGDMIMAILKDQGYKTGVLSKVLHSTPDTSFKWGYIKYQSDLGFGRDPSLYYQHATEFFAQCKEEGKKFYFMINSDDPHRPYYNPDASNATHGGQKPPSRLYTPSEVEVPGFVADVPKVREEISWYFNSVKRLDDTFGKVMLALEESGFAENTIVLFLSDNGIAIPFAKANTYFASNRTPWLMKWPGIIDPGQVDDQHFISEVDFLPTILEALQVEAPGNIDGRSFLPVLYGETQVDRDMVYCQIDNKISGGPTPMRSVISKDLIYIFNPWADGERIYRNNNEGRTMAGMVEAANTDPEIAARVDLFRKRTLEELYDLQKDPDCLNNLIGNPDYDNAYTQMSQEMRDVLVESDDLVLEIFDNRHDPEKLLESFYRLYPKAEIADVDKAMYSARAHNYSK
jgi:N-sulfoglucosamine sulfohydrolase